MDRCSAPLRRRRVVSTLEADIMEPVFLGIVFAIMWLSASLLAADLENLRAAERRLALCPAHAR
jgi:hypothetical protein